MQDFGGKSHMLDSPVVDATVAVVVRVPIGSVVIPEGTGEGRTHRRTIGELDEHTVGEVHPNLGDGATLTTVCSVNLHAGGNVRDVDSVVGEGGVAVRVHRYIQSRIGGERKS